MALTAEGFKLKAATAEGAKLTLREGTRVGRHADARRPIGVFA